MSATMTLAPALHGAISVRLAALDQRYTPLRRALVETLATSPRPLSIPEILAAVPELPQSSAYRNLTTLIEVGVVRRVATANDHGRFELSEEFSGHHHHVVCSSCGKVEDIPPSRLLERAMEDVVRAVSEQLGYEVTDHRVELIGTCPQCSRVARQSSQAARHS